MPLTGAARQSTLADIVDYTLLLIHDTELQEPRTDRYIRFLRNRGSYYDVVALYLDVYDSLSGEHREPVAEEELHRRVEEILSDDSDVIPTWLTPGVLTACRYAGWTIAAFVVQAAEEILPDGRRLEMRRRTEESSD
ncbi:hypothetical protein [Nesterenkonia marinintestina]|uniref:hypothetical protein n=1 Tax=Nesterenkonia marinintestina TaxID=2979865 RepID=UPI0021BE8C7B|nr:hypothetical protein [Nesterenkonia sp. GX14115]